MLHKASVWAETGRIAVPGTIAGRLDGVRAAVQPPRKRSRGFIWLQHLVQLLGQDRPARSSYLLATVIIYSLLVEAWKIKKKRRTPINRRSETRKYGKTYASRKQLSRMNRPSSSLPPSLFRCHMRARACVYIIYIRECACIYLCRILTG